jgi:hypothetical protein
MERLRAEMAASLEERREASLAKDHAKMQQKKLKL